MDNAPQRDDSGVFVSRALPRSRAWLALIFLGASLLAIGGAIEFSTGSPMTTGQGAASYWAIVFGFHAVVFGGASLIGALPALAVRPVKLVWWLASALLYVAAFTVWRGHAGAAPLADWFSLSPPYLPAVLPLATGSMWRNHALIDEESLAADR